MEKVKSVIDWIWKSAKTTEKIILNEKFIVEYKWIKGKMPKRMTDLIRKHATSVQGGYRLEIGHYRLFARNYNPYVTGPNLWAFSIHNELQAKALLNGEPVFSEIQLI
jgi:hypothetical protein